MKEIKDCPFCGAEAYVFDIDDHWHDIGCKTTGCFLEYGADWAMDDINELIDMWNKRAGDPS